MNKETYLVKRIEMIEEELDQLKKVITGGTQKNINLLGAWEGVDFPDELIEKAKRSLFRGIDVDDSE